MPKGQLQGSHRSLALSVFAVADVTSWVTVCFLPLGGLRQN